MLQFWRQPSQPLLYVERQERYKFWSWINAFIIACRQCAIVIIVFHLVDLNWPDLLATMHYVILALPISPPLQWELNDIHKPGPGQQAASQQCSASFRLLKIALKTLVKKQIQYQVMIFIFPVILWAWLCRYKRGCIWRRLLFVSWLEVFCRIISIWLRNKTLMMLVHSTRRCKKCKFDEKWGRWVLIEFGWCHLIDQVAAPAEIWFRGILWLHMMA